ncbi:putative 4-hydroxy-4-methyl-2-oxoglutarate aldolase [Alicycliphilus denitrificans]|uniref:ribonuclease E activity regulator RraA n=1 Tax=Alicycliphilus denitrificans TaxID=179636 RepID=UPI000963FC9D|nr:ribonuclease E activity regulator RraA [Alicycliphilus denitrificans]MBN9575315.1 ribonuclease E activity regulator RraA [Alicycliphilus denitrificans]OJW93093.1 MAG: ribonuclease regulator [Alicycliphilus sp. 69-12]BCN37072.1 putative 4-hydroxy-4-methyl-2-oxoglutarate aldolase [Alicycliphilus denitrificans]
MAPVHAPIRPGESTADLSDRLGPLARVCGAPLRAYGGLRQACAPVATLRAQGSADGVRAWLEQPGEGRILVIDGGGVPEQALLGDRLAALGLANGWRGAIVHGAVRDVAALAAMDFAVLALGATPRRAGAGGVGAPGCALELAGVRVAPGDWVCLDRDGVVFVSVPRARGTACSARRP